jgi:hypothetical protein
LTLSFSISSIFRIPYALTSHSVVGVVALIPLLTLHLPGQQTRGGHFSSPCYTSPCHSHPMSMALFPPLLFTQVLHRKPCLVFDPLLSLTGLFIRATSKGFAGPYSAPINGLPSKYKPEAPRPPLARTTFLVMPCTVANETQAVVDAVEWALKQKYVLGVRPVQALPIDQSVRTGDNTCIWSWMAMGLPPPPSKPSQAQ